MRIAVTGPSGSGKTTVAAELARRLRLRHVEIDALHHGPNWESCGVDALRARVSAATEGDDWVTDSTYHHMLGTLVVDRADMLVWLDLPVPLVMVRLVRRTYVRRRAGTVLWNGNVEPARWIESWRSLIWPALRRAYENRHELPTRHPGTPIHRLRSDAEVRAFVEKLAASRQSSQATPVMSGSSSASALQKTPPLRET
jgi:adenylate kinase family enzyme